MIHSTVYSFDGGSQRKFLGPEPFLVLKKLSEKAIEELTAGIWRCGSCGKAEKSFLILDLHIDTGCEELSPIECDVCPAVVRSYRDFVAHFLEHQMGETRKCPICLQECIGDIRQHLILKGHFRPNMSELDQKETTSLVLSQNPSRTGCLNPFELGSGPDALFDQKTHLDNCLHSKKHRKLERCKRIYIEKKPFKCNVCKKFFSAPWKLDTHQRVHTGEKLFKCDLCKKRFSTLRNLNIHQRCHTGERPFKCDLCKKCFADLRNLNIHQRCHTGERPFKCDLCKKCFADSSNLNVHQRVHTGQKPFECDICNKKIFSIKQFECA